MGWFNWDNKTLENDDIVFANLPQDNQKATQLKGNHPVVIISADNDN
jgi:hypothetical protein